MTAAELIFKMASLIGSKSSFDEFTTSPAIGIAVKSLTGVSLSSATVYNDGRIEIRTYGPEDLAMLTPHFECRSRADTGYKGLIVELLPA